MSILPKDSGDFNIELARESVDAFVGATGVGCSVINSDGSFIYSNKPQGADCDFCMKLRALSDHSLRCDSAHVYGSFQSERFGGKYMYFCPAGMLHFASPITTDSAMRFYLIGGPALIIEKDEFVFHDLMEKHGIPEQYSELFLESLRDMPIVPTERATDLSSLLFIVASHIGNSEYLSLMEKEEHTRQQSSISEYIHLSKKAEEHDHLPKYPIETEKELLEAIAAGDRPTSNRLLNEILGHIFFSSGGKIEIIKARIVELIVLLSRASLDGGADIDQIFGLSSRYLDEIDNYGNIEDLSYWLSRVMARFTNYVFDLKDIKHIDVIYKAVNYINDNYMNKLSLEEVARHVFFSPSYFSKVFKDEMHQNFNAYLNRVRIEKSKKLLLIEQYHLVDIAEMVGFEDQSYFSKVFKKLTGMTPGKYRESRGKLARRDA